MSILSSSVHHESGFGFIEKADGSGDVFCGRRDVSLHEDDRNPKVGSHCEFAVEDIGKGPRAVNVTQIGGGLVDGGRSKGTLSSWDPDRNTGTITAADGTGDFPVSTNDIWEISRALVEGDEVRFDPRDSKCGWYAVYVTCLVISTF